MYLLWVVRFVCFYAVTLILLAAATSSGHTAFNFLSSAYSHCQFEDHFLPCFVLLARQPLKRESESVKRESVCSACQSLHSSHLPYAPWICAHLQLVVTGCYLAGRHSLRCQWKETGGELLIYKVLFFCTMRQPLKNLCRLQTGCLYQVNYTTIVTFICYFFSRSPDHFS